MTDPFSTVALLAGVFASVGGSAATAGIRELHERLFPAMPDPGALEIARAVRRAQLRALRAAVEAYAAHHQDAGPRHLVEALRFFVNTAAHTPTEAAPAVEARLRPLLAGHETADLRPVCEDLTLDEAAASAEDAPGFDAFAAVVRGGGAGFAGWWPSFRAALAEEIAGNDALQVVLAQRAVLETLGRVDGLAAVLAELLGEVAADVERLIEENAKRWHGIRPELGFARADVARERIQARPTEMLVARYGIVPYLDRGGILADLMEWLEGDARPRGRLYVAGGGFGKTRLALEAIRRLGPGWRATFVNSTNAAGVAPGAWDSLLTLAEGEAGVLVVLDYAEGQIPRLREVAAAAKERIGRVRILALARSTEGWWEGVNRESGIGDVFALSARTTLEAPLDAADRTRLHAAAAASFAANRCAQGLDARDDAPPLFDLAGPLFGRPLGVAMGAYLAVADATPEGESVFATMLGEERKHWRRVVGADRDDDPRMISLHRLMAQVTLMQGASREAAHALMQADPRAVSLPRSECEATFSAARALYGAPGGGLRPMEPDVLGEHIAMAALAEDMDGLAAETFVRTAEGAPLADEAIGAMLTVLTRAQREVHEAGTREAATAAIAAMTAVAPGLSAAAARRVEAALPWQATNTARLAVAVLTRVRDTAADQVEAARAASNLGNRLWEVGAFREALEPARRAVEISEALAAAEPARFRPGLAASLNNYANRLSNVGEARAALKPARRAVEIREALAAAEPERFLPDLAETLSNYAVSLFDVGETRAALEPARRAVEILETLATAEPARFRPNLAGSLNNYAISLADVREARAALGPARRAVEIRETLAAAEPARFRPDLAMSLGNYAGLLAAIGEARAALESDRRSIAIFETLAAAEPARFLPDLATSLSNYALHLSSVGDPRAALEPARRAVEIRGRLAEAEPARFLPDLARSHGVLGEALLAAGDHEQAVEAFEASLRAIRGPAEALPAAFGSNQTITPAISMRPCARWAPRTRTSPRVWQRWASTRRRSATTAAERPAADFPTPTGRPS